MTMYNVESTTKAPSLDSFDTNKTLNNLRNNFILLSKSRANSVNGYNLFKEGNKTDKNAPFI